MEIGEIAENAIKIISKNRNVFYEEESLDLRKIQEVLSSGGSLILRKKDLNTKIEKNVLDLISSLGRLGIKVVFEEESEIPEPSDKGTANLSPEKQILEDILSEVIEKEGPCIVEPGKTCINCGGRCKTLGF